MSTSDEKSNKLMFWSLKRRTWLMMAMLLCFIGGLVVFLYTAFIMNSAEETAKKEGTMGAQNAMTNIQIALDSYNDMSRLIMMNPDVITYMSTKTYENDLDSSAARRGIYSVTNIYTFVDSVYLIRNDGSSVNIGQGITYISRDYMLDPEWYSPVANALGGNVIMINGGGAVYKKGGASLISMVRDVYDMDTQRVLGTLIINMSTDVFADCISKSTVDSSHIAIWDEHGNILFGNPDYAEYYLPGMEEGQTTSTTIRRDGKQYALTRNTSEGMPIQIVSLTAVSMTDVMPEGATAITILLIAAFILSVFISGIFITVNIASPIERLTIAIEQTKKSGWLEKLNVKLPNHEIRRLADSYNSVIEHLNDVFTKLIENEKNVQKAELRILHEQIKPHFLYNSLETISYMSVQSNAPQVHDALETLGSFYRNFLSKGDREIPLRKEIAITKDYLSLQKLRYAEVFDDIYDLDESVLDIRVPKLILQPLVENSIYHGVRLKGEKGIIKITVKGEEDGVHIIVYDSGVGMSQKQIDSVLLLAQEKDENSSFGLRGTIERIRYYGNGGDAVTITSEEGEYTKVEIVLPRSIT